MNRSSIGYVETELKEALDRLDLGFTELDEHDIEKVLEKVQNAEETLEEEVEEQS
jgi:hypothetical protein